MPVIKEWQLQFVGLKGGNGSKELTKDLLKCSIVFRLSEFSHLASYQL